MAYKPNQGDAGFFNLKAPFSGLINPDSLYTCQSVRSINDYIASGESVYDKYYAPLKISDDEYQQDIADNVCIVGLQAGIGEWVYVPTSYILTAPINNGVKYIPVVMGISLGPIPDDYNLEAIKQQMLDIALNTFGVEAEVKGAVVGSPKWLTNEEHELLEVARREKITGSTSSIVLARMYAAENESLRKVIAEYEKILKIAVPDLPNT